MCAPSLLPHAQLDAKTASNLEQLEAGLSSAMQRGGAGSSEEDVAGIVTPADECEHWRLNSMGYGAAASGPRAAEVRGRAEQFWAVLGPVAERLAGFAQLPAAELEELLQEMQDVLDGLHRMGFNEARMMHLMSVVGSALDGHAKQALGKLKVWSDPFRKVSAALRESIALCDAWSATTATLTTQFWVGSWKGGRFNDELLGRLQQRLHEVLTMRTVQHQLLGLLSEREMAELHADEVFAPFEPLSPLHHSPYARPAWDAATSEYMRLMSPIERDVARKLHARLSTSGLKGHALLRDALRHKELVLRPTVFAELAPAREGLLGQMEGQLEVLREDFEARTGKADGVSGVAPPGGGGGGGGGQTTGKNMPEVVSQVVLARQLQDKVGEMLSAAETLLHDLQGMARFLARAQELHVYLNDYAQQQYAEWVASVEGELHDDRSGLAMQLTGKLLEVSKEDLSLKVNYSDRLVRFLREVRQLTAMGFKMPEAVQWNADVAHRFYRHGVVLKQVAHFYNNIDTQIVRSQKPLLLDFALQFEHLATNPRAEATADKGGKSGGKIITWSDPNQLEAYIGQLHAAAERLTQENRKLRQVHTMMGEQVAQLMDVSLLRQQAKWKERVESLRATVDGLQPHYTGMKGWRMHWDMQLFKVLEHQYQAGLEGLHQDLPQIKCDLEFKNRRLQLRPALEELRTEFYREIKKFISIPTSFKGLGYFEEGAGGKHKVLKIFRDMPDRNLRSLQVVYRKASELFQKLEAVLASYKPYLVLGLYEGSLDDLVEEHCTEASAFEASFKALKAKRKEAEKLPNFEKVDCLTVSLAPLKAALEDQHQKTSDALLFGMRRMAATRQKEIDDFVNESMEALARRPQSVDEIGAAKREWTGIFNGKDAVKAKFKRLEELSRMMRSVSRSGLELAALTSRWEELELTLDAFNDRIEDQMTHLRGQMAGRVTELQGSVQKFSARWFELKPKKLETNNRDEMMEVIARVKEWQSEFEEVTSASEKLVLDCEHFSIAPPQLVGLEDVKADIEAYVSSCAVFEGYMAELDTLAKEDWISFRQRLWEFDDFVASWGEKSKACPPGTVADHLRNELSRFRDVAPLLRFVRGEAFQPEHWATLVRKLGLDPALKIDKLCFSHFLEAAQALADNAEEVRTLNARAQGEVAIREAVQEVRNWSQEASFSLTEHDENGRQTPLIKDWKDLTTQVSDLQALLGSLKESPFFGGFADQVNQYTSKLTVLDGALAQLNPIQRKWVYLEPIFGRGAMPHEQARFKRVDEDFRAIMLGIGDDARVFSLTKVPDLESTLAAILDQLERCQKALADFLEEKRQRFPRFYFIGDDDLLEILGQAKNPVVIQSHLKKLFAGISKVQFSEGNASITAMCSLEGEVVPLLKPVAISDAVESWLQLLSAQMKATLQQRVADTLSASGLDLERSASQVLCVAEVVSFTRDCEAALGRGRGGLDALKKELLGKLKEYTSYETDVELLSLKMKALVMDLIHHIDVVDQQLAANTTSATDWAWRKQLRYYFSEQQTVKMRMVSAEFAYTYEYQGNAGKLVHTPLTDKCYLTLTQAMFMGYGGNPYGPAGTGKTESVKALGGAFGRQVLVFNCDEGIDSKSMGRIFVGLVKCGAWGCFDEFNRLLPDQLSEISQSIQVIQNAIKRKEPRCEVNGTATDVDPNAGIFITMNPAGKGYGGRSKLPDNLTALFRAVAMSKPDIELISEVMMYSEGFATAKALAVKLVAVFQLSKQLLSRQQHYDWGLRALKTVLRNGGQLIHEQKKKGELTPQLEETVLIQALRVNTLSKLTYSDTAAFNALIGDIFPGATVSDVAYEQLEAAVREVLQEEKLEALPLQVRKILQFHEACQQRMGVVVVGPSGCGKSTIWKVLKAALAKLGQKIPTYVMNPKAMPREQLLGHMDMDTREWFDGVLTSSARKVVREPPEVKSWIICDGDIDPEWVESLNSVLDDNRLLTMPSGERIQFGPNVNFIFETHDLKFASPATVSRMGMIFLDEESSDINCIVTAWIRRQPEELQTKLQGWVDDFFFKALEWVLAPENASARVVETTKAGVVHGALSHLVGVASKPEFTCAAVRGFGSNLYPEKRAELARLLYSWTNEAPADHRRPLDGFYNKPMAKHDLYADEQVAISFDELTSDEGAMVRTASVQRDEHMLEPWMERMEPLILVGPEGAGKHMLLAKMFARSRGTQVAVVHCSAQTLSTHVIHKLSQACAMSSTQQGRVYRPKDASRVVLYLKDINLPKPDKYDTAELVAFLQQIATYGGFYDKNLDFVGLKDVHVVASMNPSGNVGRYPLSTRFTANVRLAYVSYPDKDALNSIYSALLSTVLSRQCQGSPTWDNPGAAKKLAACMVDVYEAVRKKFSVDEQRHYLFTPRDLSAWLKGLLRYELQDEGAPLFDVWAFEGSRQLRDRLVSRQDRSRFDNIISSSLRSHFNAAVEADGVTYSPLLVGASERVGAAPDRALTLKRASLGDYNTEVLGQLKRLEREVKELDLVLFPEALANVVRMERVLSMPGGHLLLVGSSGVGRRSLLTLVCFMHGIELISPAMVRDYSLKSFRAELKTILPKAGVQGTPVCLLLEDHQLRGDALIECVNSILSSGEIPGLFEPQELEPLLAPLKEEMGQHGFKYRSLFDFFVARVQRYLHVALCMDNANDNFLVRCESNPALYTRCAMMWMGTWDDTSMDQLPAKFFDDIPEEHLEPERRPAVVKTMMAIHNSTGAAAVTGDMGAASSATPRMYVSFLEVWKKIFTRQRAKTAQRVEHLKGGLDKLHEATIEVDKLSKTAVEQRALLTTKQQEADVAMEHIQKSMEKAVERKAEVEQLQKKLGVEQEEMDRRKGGIEQELAGIQPVLEAAKAAVGGIKSDNLNEIRSLKMPPEAIRDVLEGVLRLMGNFDTSWISMKRFLGNKSVKDEIINFDSRKITPEIREGVMEIVNQKSQSFEHATIYRVSVAAAPLAAWVKANLEYSAVLVKISPLMEANDQLQAELESSKERLEKCKSALSMLDGKVVELRADFSKRTAEAESLKVSLAKAEETLGSAQTLLEKLSGERGRWDTMMGQLGDDMSAIAANALLSAGFVTYLADEQEAKRAEVMAEWVQSATLNGLLAPQSADGGKMAMRSSVTTGGFSLMTFLSSEGELLRWKSQGLPADKLSSENAIVILNAQQPPLIIDPSSQATEWLKTYLQADGGTIEAVTPHEQRFAKALELGVRFGKTMVVSEADDIHPMLVPLLRRDLARQGPRFVVQVGDKAIDYNESFRLFLTTRNPNPDVPPDVASLVTVVNFSVTMSGLEGQLLGITIQHEKPELEKQKSTLLAAEDELKIQLEQMEQKLLQELASSEGNILENKTLLSSLNELKSKSMTVKDKLEEASQLQESLDGQREVYRTIAQVGSRLFFTLLDLRRVNPMYRYSLPMFLALFKKALGAKELEHAQEDERVRSLGPLLIRLVFGSVSRSLFKEDRLTYAVHLVHLLQPQLFGENEWELFSGALLVGDATSGPSLPPWADADRGSAFASMGAALPGVVSQLNLHDGRAWEAWAQSDKCEVEFPPTLPPGVSPFQRVLLVQALRPERLPAALFNFATATMGIASLSPMSSSLAQIHELDSSAPQPILMITTPGADPTQELEDYAARVVPGKFRQLAMGGQQTRAAIELLYEAAKAGNWLCLKNLHLVVHWVPQLEKALSAITPHPQFRLWLTTEPHAHFPAILLQQSLKITFEAPPGLQKNLQRTFESLMHRDYFERGSATRAQLLFVLAWFHAVLQERRTYIPQGWTKFYEFSPSDLRSAADICDSAGGVATGQPDWVTIHGLLGTAIYGGRVDNQQDERLLHVYLQQFFSSSMLTQKERRLAPGVVLPSTSNHGDYLAIISRLPAQDTPALFGLPANSDRYVETAKGVHLQTTLRRLGTDATAAASFDREAWSAALSPMLGLWAKLTQGCEGLRQGGGRDPSEGQTSVECFVLMELGKARALLKTVDESLGALGRLVRGTELLGAQTKTEGNALMSGGVPASWAALWEGPEAPAPWIQQAVARLTALQGWQQALEMGQLLRAPVKLSELLNPAFFLTALRQQTARQARVPMDGLRLMCGLNATDLGDAPLRFQVDGLLVQGASCAAPHGLAPLADGAPTFAMMPPIHLAWLPHDARQPYPAERSALIPVYENQSREVLLSELRLPCTGLEATWLQAGCALFLEVGL